MEKPQSFQHRKEFLNLTAKDERILQGLHAALGEGAPGFVEGFYRHLLSFEEMRALIPDDDSLARLQRLQTRYFHTLTAGRYDEAYGLERQRVGLTHARVGLPPGWYLGAYSQYLTQLLPVVARLGLPADDWVAALQALVKVVFLDMGLAIDTYIALRDEMISELRDYGAAFARLPYGTVVATADLDVVFANEAFAHLAGCAPEALVGHPLGALMDVGGLPALAQQALLHGHARGTVQLRPRAQALALPVAVTAHTLQPGSGAAPRLLLTIEDLREREQLLRDLLNAQEVANIGTWHTLFDGRIALTPQAARILGWPEGQPFGYGDLLDCVHPEDRGYADAQWAEGLARGHHAFSLRVRHGGQVRWVDLRGRTEHGAAGQPVRGYGTVLDITERHHTEQYMQRLAFFDTLTGLPNRMHGMKQVQRLLHEAGEQKQRAVVLFADLDKFKEINDTQGHAAGDRVLVAVARHCQDALDAGGVLARLGGDEFMFAHPLADGEDVLALARQVHAALQRPVWVDGLRFEVGASIGVALYPAHGQDVDELLQCADMAMYRAKMQGCGCLLYDEALGRQVQRRIALGTRLEAALQQSLLELHFQPKVDIASGRIVGVEALARWHDAEWGWVSPAEFIAAAEERGLIMALGDWSLDAAARQWRAWRDAGVARPPPIAVNVSATQMMGDAFAERALALVRAHGVRPQAIELEITESALMLHPDRARRVASRLVELGFTLSLDDFGTGYSSLARLRDFPVSRIKIDMSFVHGMLAEPGHLAIVTAVIGMARALGLRTVAEGVETQEQRHRLHALQCDEVQGWLFGRAMPAAELERRWLRPAPLPTDDTLQG